MLRHKKKHSPSQDTNAVPVAVEVGAATVTNGVAPLAVFDVSSNTQPVTASGQDLLTMAHQKPLGASLVLAAERDDLSRVRKMLADGVPVDSRDAHGYTSLICATVNASLPLVHLLVEKGANVSAQGRDGRTPLMYAVMNGPVEVVELLLDKGAEMEARDENGSTALIWGAALGKVETTTALLKRKPSLDAKDNLGRTAAAWADANRHPKVAKLLEDAALHR